MRNGCGKTIWKKLHCCKWNRLLECLLKMFNPALALTLSFTLYPGIEETFIRILKSVFGFSRF